MENSSSQSGVVETPAHWRALWHPLRVGILRLLGEREMTNEELARALGVASGKLYHHTRLLLKAGMIELAGTRPKGGITEKLYRASARRLIAKDAGVQPLAHAIESARELFEATRRESPHLKARGGHAILGVSPARVAELHALFERIVRESAEHPPQDAVPYALTLLTHSLPSPEAIS